MNVPVDNFMGHFDQPHCVVQFECYFMVGLGSRGSVAGGAGRDCAAGHAVSAGTNTSGAGAQAPGPWCVTRDTSLLASYVSNSALRPISLATEGNLGSPQTSLHWGAVSD